jgi:hypothetical protein
VTLFRKYNEGWMLTYHDDFGTLLEHCGGSRHLPPSMAMLGGPEPSHSEREVTDAPVPKLRLSEAELSAQEDATGLPLRNVRHTYEVRVRPDPPAAVRQLHLRSCIRWGHTQVLHPMVYVRKEPRLKARLVKTLKCGELIDVDGLQGSWGRAVIAGTYDSAGECHTPSNSLPSLLRGSFCGAVGARRESASGTLARSAPQG